MSADTVSGCQQFEGIHMFLRSLAMLCLLVSTTEAVNDIGLLEGSSLHPDVSDSLTKGNA
ncbi:hypothetical protein [Aestuariivirga sp.]|uniref:hypothetical protein n=1 Tax=Aestuariivirga sp. TaxID=2650926 RepID=UPI003593DD2C